MKPTKRLMWTLLTSAFIGGALAACQSPTLPPLPSDQGDNNEPTKPDPDPDGVGFLLFPDSPMLA